MKVEDCLIWRSTAKYLDRNSRRFRTQIIHYPLMSPLPRRRSMNQIDEIEKAQKRDNIPSFQPGDTLRVHVRIKEGNKERLQMFEGICIARKNGGIRETITVRKTSFGVGVERVFPLHATIIDHIDVVRYGKVRRAKLYYLRDLRGKAARIPERDMRKKKKSAKK